MHIEVGDLFSSKASTLVNTVNCVGVMGKGIAKEFKQKYPAMFKDYKSRCSAGLVKLGEPYLYTDLLGTSILNFPTKNHWRSSSRIRDISDGLDWFVAHYNKLGISSIAFPPLGCGNGGLSWHEVGPLMYQKLKDLPIEIWIYAPFGTEDEELSESYLAHGSWDPDAIGCSCRKLNRTWNLVLFVMKRLEQNTFSLPVGHTIYQKICYVLTRSGVDTGFVFDKGAYGPYSADAKRALSDMANEGFVVEKQLGKMQQICVVGDFRFDKSRYSSEELNAAYAAVDLFSRLKNTEQAEEMASLLYAYSDICTSEKNGTEVTEHDVLDYLYEWKARWKNDAQKEASLREAMYYLTALGWMNIGQLSFEELV